MRQRRAMVRRGLSLLEVLVALAVFLISYIAIWQLMNLASDNAIELGYRNQATHLAQRKLAEIAAGVEPMQANGDAPFEDPDGDYTWSADVEAGLVDSLQTVTVTVSRESQGRTTKVSVSQMMINPTNLGSTQDVWGPVVSSAASASSSSSSGSSGSSTTPATPAAPAAPASSSGSMKSTPSMKGN